MITAETEPMKEDEIEMLAKYVHPVAGQLFKQL
jgi:hypothetical protein